MSELNQFLSEVQARAYRMAFAASKNHADALDIVQDAMTKLVQRYATEPPSSWPMLFQRILQNRITDSFRYHSKVIKLFTSSTKYADDDECVDYEPEAEFGAFDPGRIVLSQDHMERVLELVSLLPIRQQQVFLLRMLEQYDVAETAEILKCSVSSVKTHYGRALLRIRHELAEEYLNE